MSLSNTAPQASPGIVADEIIVPAQDGGSGSKRAFLQRPLGRRPLGRRPRNEDEEIFQLLHVFLEIMQ